MALGSPDDHCHSYTARLVSRIAISLRVSEAQKASCPIPVHYWSATRHAVSDRIKGFVTSVGVKGGGTACDQVHFRPSTVLPYGPPSHNRAS